MPEARACATRMLRVYLLFPPRSWIGAHSSKVTPTPESAAAKAAQRAALPPPTTSTSTLSRTSGPCWSVISTALGCIINRLGPLLQQPRPQFVVDMLEDRGCAGPRNSFDVALRGVDLSVYLVHRRSLLAG